MEKSMTLTTSGTKRDGGEPVTGRRISHTLTGIAAIIALGTSACSGLLGVDAPDVVQPTQLQNASGAEALTSGALSAIYANFIAHVNNVGIFTDEMTYAS